MWNHIKGGIFSPGGRAARDAESGGILAVWGAPGSGKTSVAVKLAKQLAEKKKPTALLLCDMTAPMLPCISPGSELANERSLTNILNAANPGESLIRHNAVVYKQLDSLFIFGLLKGENELSCTRRSLEQDAGLIRAIEGIAPYVIVDCSSYISGDTLSTAALMEADRVLRISGCDLKSVSYFSSQLPLFKEANWNSEKQIKAVSYSSPGQVPKQMTDSSDCALPYSHELAEQFLAGNLFENFTQRDSRAFSRELKKICREVFGC